MMNKTHKASSVNIEIALRERLNLRRKMGGSILGQVSLDSEGRPGNGEGVGRKKAIAQGPILWSCLSLTIHLRSAG